MKAIHIRIRESQSSESTFDFILPFLWETGIDHLASLENDLAHIEKQLDDKIFALYDISEADREAIRAELNQEKDDEVQEEEAARSC